MGTMPPFSKEKNDIKLRASQVVLYIDQWDHVKQKFNALRSNWLDVYFNLTKYVMDPF